MSTPTPRTDAAYAKWQEGWDRTPFGPDFARTLERELAVEREKVKTLREACKTSSTSRTALRSKLAAAIGKWQWMTRGWPSPPQPTRCADLN